MEVFIGCIIYQNHEQCFRVVFLTCKILQLSEILVRDTCKSPISHKHWSDRDENHNFVREHHELSNPLERKVF